MQVNIQKLYQHILLSGSQLSFSYFLVPSMANIYLYTSYQFRQKRTILCKYICNLFFFLPLSLAREAFYIILSLFSDIEFCFLDEQCFCCFVLISSAVLCTYANECPCVFFYHCLLEVRQIANIANIYLLDCWSSNRVLCMQKKHSTTEMHSPVRVISSVYLLGLLVCLEHSLAWNS